MTEDDCRKVFMYIEEKRSEAIALESLLTSIKALAPENGGDGELAKCEALQDWLKSHGITQLERFDAPDARVSAKIRPNLVATIPGELDTNLWIMSHLDVVPEGDSAAWETDPWQVVEKDGRLFGRGVEDDQQGLVSSVFGALALVNNNIKPKYTVKLLFVADEEVGSKYGINYILNNHELFQKDDLIIVPDSGDPNGETIEIAEKNILWLKFNTIGKQAHASMPDKGINAFLANCDLATKLNLLESYFDWRDNMFDPDRSTFQPTKKDANVPNVNTIPGEDAFYLDCRILPTYSLAEVRKEIDHCVREVEKKHKVKIEVSVLQAVESRATDGGAPVINLLTKAIKTVHGKKARLVGIGGGTVAAELRNKGLNPVVWGTIYECAHQPNEFIDVKNLLADAKIFALVAMGAGE